jgi:hypothetical protein
MRQPTIGESEALARFESELAGLRAARQDDDPRPDGAPGYPLAATVRRPAPDDGGEDLDLLLGAIKARLRIAAASAPEPRPQGGGAADSVLILECVDALDLLQLMLRQKLAHRPAAMPALNGRGPAGSTGPLSSLPRLPATAPAVAAPSAGWVSLAATGSTR